MNIFHKLNKDGKGVLGEEINKKHYKEIIGSLSFIVYFVPFIIANLIFNPDIKGWGIFNTVYILWYFGGIFISVDNPNKIGEYFNFIVLLPVSISVTIAYNIFKTFMKIKYPEIPRGLYERKIKIQKILKVTKHNKRYEKRNSSNSSTMDNN